MIKKYFALSLIVASIAVAGCSDDDDDDNNGPGVPPVGEHPDATPGVGGSVYDTIFASPDHTMLLAAIDTAGLADMLDDESTDYTVFAPNDAAFAALETAPVGDELVRTLEYHVVEGTYDAETLAELVNVSTDDATLPTLLDDASLTFTTSDEGQGLAVDGSAIIGPDLYPVVDEGEVTTGVVHSIGTVLTPPADVPGPTEPPVTSGDVDATLAADGNYEIFRNAVSRDFGTNLDDSAWTVFIPNDATLSAAGLSDLTAPQQQAHIVSSGALDPTALAGSETVTASNNTTYTVSSDGTTTTVDGKEVALITTGAGGAQIYSIDGVLGATE